MLWEDVFFALDVAPHAQVISVLADTPFYHWVRGGKTRRRPTPQTRGVLALGPGDRATDERQALRAGLEGQWRLMLLHQYRSRVLTRSTAVCSPRPSADFPSGRRRRPDHQPHPRELDADLTPTHSVGPSWCAPDAGICWRCWWLGHRPGRKK